jgi:hypothetical protein
MIKKSTGEIFKKRTVRIEEELTTNEKAIKSQISPAYGFGLKM